MTSTLTATSFEARPATSSTAPRAVRRRVDPATYRRRRIVAGCIVIGCIVAVLTFVGAAISDTLTGLGGTPAAAEAQSAYERVTVVAHPGDTLWSIAHAHRGAVDHAVYVDALVMLNGGASIQAGQRIVLP